MKIFKSILSAVGISATNLDNVHIEGHDPILPSPFLIGEAGAAALAAVGYLAAELEFLKNHQWQQVNVNVKAAAFAQRAHQYLLVNGKTEELWHPLSSFYPTKDNRWIQLHCNFPHHAQGVIDFLKCSNDKQSVAAAIKNWQAETLETALAERGLCAAMVRTSIEWEAHPQEQAIATLPLMEIIKLGDTQPMPLPSSPRLLSGIKMLDLTRVIAGPVTGKLLAELGATVMLISSPNLPFIAPLVIDTGFGKFSAYLDLNNYHDKQQLIELIKTADVFSQSYRPGGLAARGFSPQQLATLRPGIICIDLSAYSHVGPWANRHGYDSLVQSATGIVSEQSGGDKPEHLPAQSLDYITGFLAAFGAMEAIKRRAVEGGSYLVRVSLAQTAHWFKKLGRVTGDFTQCKIPTREHIKDLLTQTETEFGKVEHMLPVLNLSATPLLWERAVVPLGKDPALWPIIENG